jgi:hypothetical protein
MNSPTYSVLKAGLKVPVGAYSNFQNFEATVKQNGIKLFDTSRAFFQTYPFEYMTDREISLSICSTEQLGIEEPISTRDVFSALELRDAQYCFPEVVPAFLYLHADTLHEIFMRTPGLAQRGLNLFMQPVGEDRNDLSIVTVGFTTEGHAYIGQNIAHFQRLWRQTDIFLYAEPEYTLPAD